MSGIPWRIILVVEGSSDPPRIRMLVDHFLQKHALQKRADAPVRAEDLRRFEQIDLIDFRHEDCFVYVKQIPEIIRTLKLPRYSNFGHGDLGTLRRLKWILNAQSLLEGSVVIWSRDEDGDSVRKDDADTAQKDGLFERLIRALASECGEAWIVAGYRPTSKEDLDALKKLKKKVGFDPCARPELLSHKDGANVPRSAKQAMRDLFDGDIDRQEEALLIAATTDNPASIACGLGKFRDDMEAWLGGA